MVLGGRDSAARLGIVPIIGQLIEGEKEEGRRGPSRWMIFCEADGAHRKKGKEESKSLVSGYPLRSLRTARREGRAVLLPFLLGGRRDRRPLDDRIPPAALLPCR